MHSILFPSFMNLRKGSPNEPSHAQLLNTHQDPVPADAAAAASRRYLQPGQSQTRVRVIKLSDVIYGRDKFFTLWSA